NLTLDNNSNTATGQEQQDTANSGAVDVHNACRNAMWYDSKGNHVNRAKALFCCDSQPKVAYLSDPSVAQPAALDPNWRKAGVVDTGTPGGGAAAAPASLPDTTPAAATAAWADEGSSTAVNGKFNYPLYMDGQHPQAPLLRATGPAVSLISHGGDGSLAFLPEQ